MKSFAKVVVLIMSVSGLLAACGSDVAVTPPVTEAPALSGAISLSNTSLLVSYNKAMGPSVLQKANYVITQENVNPEVGTLTIYDISYPAGETTNSSVIITTSPQNEVTYRVSVTDVKDSDGTVIPAVSSSFGVVIDPHSTTFAGAAPSQINITLIANGAGGFTGWGDSNDNGVVDSGDSLSTADGTIVLADANGDGQLDNWTDSDNSGSITSGDSFTGFQDSDADGLSDSQELYGSNVFIEKANGEVVVIAVTSDPNKADTDGDGLSDLEEASIGSNPRSTDTDSDGIADYTEWNIVYSNPNAQDTDLDGLTDGSEHNFYHTSPLLADSDGDQLSDSAELLELNRNPRIADLPHLKISVGDVRLQIDERYSYTDESGQTVTQESSSNTTLANSQNHSFSSANSHTLEFTGAASIRAGFGVGFYAGDGYGAGVEGTVSAGFSDSNTQQTESVSAKESQQVYENSLSKGREFSTTSTVTREVVGASIDIDLTITNTGNIPFTVSNIEVTVLQQVGYQGKLLPVATLVSNSELVTGTPLRVNLGPFTSERGPFLFTSREVFPNLVEAIMRNPSGLVFQVANYDISDELGRNYAFANQVARDRTASITLDFGDAAAAKNYLVATNGAQDDQNIAGGGYLGGFNATNGSSLGLPISYVLQNILKIPRQDTKLDKIVAGTNGTLESAGANLKGDDKVENINGDDVITAGANGWLETRPIGDDFVENPAIANGIVAGLNKTADSIAQGDDIQLVPLNTKGLSIGTIVVDPGANGVLDTPKLGDDAVDFVLGYETSRSCSALSNKAGDICRIDTDCKCQPGDTDRRCNNPAPVSSGSCSGPQRLVRVNSLRNGDYNRGWLVLTSGSLPAAADFDQIIVNPGNDLTLAFLQDLDNDGIFARNEFLFGSTDSSTDAFNNNDFGENFDQSITPVCIQPAPACDGFADSRDTDHDGLDDYAEIFVGWKVAADGGALKQVFSSPRFRDTDGDGLLDPVEQDLRRYCVNTNPVGKDDRKDALCAFQYASPVAIDDAIGIIAGPDGIANTTADADDEQLTPVGTAVAYGSPVVGPGTDGILTTALTGDDLYESQSSIPPATDPTSSDTDLDGISDFTELDGFSAGLAIIDGGNGFANSVKNGDDIQRAFVNNPVFPGSVIVLPGPNGVLDTVPYGDDFVRPATSGLVTDPLRRDTDNDQFTDGLELVLGSNPTVFDGSDFIDSDQDGLTDKEEDSLGWLVSVNGGAPFLVKSSPSLPDTDFDGLPDFVERDLGTNPNAADTDGDGISDYDEVNDLSKYTTIAALYPNLNIPLSTGGYGTNPTLTDTDGDGLSDYQELISGFRLLIPGTLDAIHVYTSALYADTDLDGRSDGQEVNRVGGPTDPTSADTDGDGRSDGKEYYVGTDPFVPDRFVTVRYSSMQLKGNVTNVGWDFYIQQPGQTNPGSLVSTAAEDIGEPITNAPYCDYITPGNLSLLYYNSTAETGFAMKQGDSVSLSGSVYDFSNCSVFPRQVACIANFRKTISYDDIASGSAPSSEVLTTTAIYGSCTQDILYEIIVQ